MSKHTDLVLLQQQAAVYLPQSLLRELEGQIDLLAYVGTLARVASTEQAATLRHAASQVASALAAVERTLLHGGILTPQQQDAFVGLVDRVLEHNRQLLDAVQSRTLAQLQDAALALPAPEPSAWEEFLDGLCFGKRREVARFLFDAE